MRLDKIGADMMVEIFSYLRVEDVANLEQTCKQINSEIERTYIWKKQAKMLLRKFQFTFLHKAAQEFSGQHNENNVKHFSKWIISILLITHNTFKEVKCCSFWEEKFRDPDFDVSYCDDDWTFENHARVVASYHTTWALRISRGDTLALKGKSFFVVDEEDDERHTNSINLSLSSNFYGLYATWLKEYVQEQDDILETQQDFLWSTL